VWALLVSPFSNIISLLSLSTITAPAGGVPHLHAAADASHALPPPSSVSHALTPPPPVSSAPARCRWAAERGELLRPPLIRTSSSPVAYKRVPLSKPLLTQLKMAISGHCKQPTQYWWVFAISKINGGLSNFTR
jgi:hypothetical protein